MTDKLQHQLKHLAILLVALTVILLVIASLTLLAQVNLVMVPAHWLFTVAIAAALVAVFSLFRLYQQAGNLISHHDAVIEDLARLKAAIQKSEGMFKAITEQTTEGITVADTQGTYIFVNNAFCNMMGYTQEELLQMTVFDMKAPEQDQSSFERTKTTREGLAVEVVLQRKDRSTFISEVIGKNIVLGGQQQVLGVVRDISAQVKAEKKIRTLSQVVEQSPISVMTLSTEGDIQYVNGAFERMTGYADNEILGKNLAALFSEPATNDKSLQLLDSMARGETWEGEVKIRKKSGDTFWEHAHFAPVRDEYNKVMHYLAVKEDISQRKKHEQKILQQAHYDALTGLPNRFLSLDRLSQMLSEAVRKDESAALLYIDLDDFKKANDTLGHETGDKLLIEAASRLKSVVRTADTVGRIGGDEFIILLGDGPRATNARRVAENLLERFRAAFTINGRELMLTASVGIAVYPEDGEGTVELLRNADSAMYHAKQQGRNSYSFFTAEMNREVTRRLSLEEQMHGALERNEFEVLYQPQVDVRTDKIVGAEALLRWHNPTLGTVSPDEFIPIAEQTGMIIPIGLYVLSKALEKAAHWQQDYDPHFRMAVNLSPRQFRDPDLIRCIEQVLAKHHHTARTLELEITEGVLLEGQRYIDESLSRLNQMGISISMDDFGTGYSSLNYLRNYPFDLLKVDRSFVKDITTAGADKKLVNAAIVMAHSLQLKVVAEGVEDQQQYALLKEMGCDFAQGFLFGKPMTAQSLTAVLSSGACVRETV